MITLPGQIKEGDNWSGRDGFNKNLESEMDFAEHQRIAFAALSLLAGDLDVPDDAAGRKLEALKDAYEAGDADDVLYIAKGIHQPDTNPHMQLKLKRGQSTWYTYHLNVTVVDQDIPGLPQAYFHWKGVQFAAEAPWLGETLTAEWPKNVAIDTKWRHARRRWSIAPKDVQPTIAAIARREREEREAAEAEQRRKEAQSKRDTDRNKIREKLTANKYSVGNGVKKIDELIDGKTVQVETQTRKKINVRWNGANLVNA